MNSRELPQPHRRLVTLRALTALVAVTATLTCGNLFAQVDGQAKNANAAKPAAKPFTLPAGIRMEKDISYIPDGDEAQKLDLYLPEQPSDKPLPLIVHIHGGGWRGGSKFPCPVAMMVLKGYAVASVEYRFSQKAIFPAQIQDCQAAIRWLRARAKQYNFDPERVGAVGSSAGGHLSALVGTSGGKKAFAPIGGHEEQSDRVQAVCDYFGPADFTTVVQQADADKNVRNIFKFNTPADPYSCLTGADLSDKSKSDAKRRRGVVAKTSRLGSRRPGVQQTAAHEAHPELFRQTPQGCGREARARAGSGTRHRAAKAGGEMTRDRVNPMSTHRPASLVITFAVSMTVLLFARRGETADEPTPRARRAAAAAAGATNAPAASNPPRTRRASATNATPPVPVSTAPAKPLTVGPEELVDFTDPTYGSKIRQLRKDDGHEHNFYYYRNPWNADGSYLLGVQSDLQQKNWHVVLHDGDGKFIKDLFTIDRYDWRLCWDGKDPDILYTWKGSDLFRFHVKDGKAELMKSFKPLSLMTSGPSVNQTGDRILVATSDKTFRSYHLPDLSDERTFQPQIPKGAVMIGWDKPRFTGYGNTIDVAFHSQDMKTQGVLVYDDTGKLVHRLDGFGGGGHCAFSPDGHVAYFFMPNYPRTDGKDSLDIHVAKLDGSEDRVVFSVPRAQAAQVQNLHLSWPAKVNGWFLASFFHFPNSTQPAYAPLFDEILQINLDGKFKYLARSGANYSRGAGRGTSTDMFWAMPLAAPQADGKRISFNSNRSGTIDQFILYVDGAPKR
ncbi:MAG: alpha/beta hydrolase [Verrucomicrobia bacterium]|nr:alpha/beta hydrolase [Verrucomicrobiota bacterium]